MNLTIFESVFLLLCGSGVFLTGMHLMGSGLEKSAGQGIRKLFNRINTNTFASYGLGVGTTAIIQSSDATTVLSMGLASAGIVTVAQGSSIALGARLGTTITGILVSLSSFNITPVLMSFSLVGILLLMFVKNKNTANSVGYILTGFGVLFSGLFLMSFSIKNNSVITGFFTSLFAAIDFPILLFLAGMIFTGIIQSSSAVCGIIIVMITAGTVDFGQAMFLVIGATVGTTVTVIIAAIGAATSAKRIAFVYVSTAFIGAIIGGGAVWIFRDEVVRLFSFIPSQIWQMSIFDVVYSALTSFICMFFIKPLVRLSEKLIKDKILEKNLSPYFLDDNMLKTPVLAVPLVKKEVVKLLELAIENLKRGFNALLKRDFSQFQLISDSEEEIDFLTRSISEYLVKLSGKSLDMKDDMLVASLHHVLDDIERIGDHGEEFLKQGEKMEREGVFVSDEAKAELLEMKNMVLDMSEYALRVFATGDPTLLPVVSDKEEKIDKEKKLLAACHVARLNSGDCSIESGTYFYAAIASLERVGDHLENVAFSVRSIVGDTD